jgi:nucleolar protein 53
VWCVCGDVVATPSRALRPLLTVMAKKKQSKASWRKRGAPIEEAAQQARRIADQDRRTGGSMANLADGQLFDVQRSAPAASAPVVGQPRRSGKGVSLKMLAVDRAVAPNRHIPVVTKPAIAKSNKAPTARTLMLRKKLGKVAKGLVQQAAQRQLAQVAAPAPAEALDIWGSDAVAAPAGKRSRGAVLRRAPEQSTHTAAVAVPSEGASWNPTFEAHQELLSEAHEHEVERLRREKLHRFPLIEHSDDEDTAPSRAPAAEGVDVETDESDAEEEEGSGEIGDGPSWHVEHKKLTTVQKNRRERALARQKAEQEAKVERKREKQLGRVDTLLAEVRKEDADLRRRQAQEAAWDAERPKKLGPKRYAERRPDVLLTEEQPAALRQLKAEGSLLVDRFESMQARNLVEVRNKLPKRAKKGPHRTVARQTTKDILYKSPHYKGELPAWM